MKITKQKAEYISMAIDMLVRQTGIQNAPLGLAIIAEMQADLSETESEPKDKTE